MPSTDDYENPDDHPAPDNPTEPEMREWQSASAAAWHYAAMCGVNTSSALGHDVLATRREVIALMWGELTDQINGHFELCGAEEVRLHRDEPIVASVAQHVGITFDELPSPAYTLRVTRDRVVQEIKGPGAEEPETQIILWPPADRDGEGTGVIYRLMLDGKLFLSVAVFYHPGDRCWTAEIRSKEGDFAVTRDDRRAAETWARAHAEMHRMSEVSRLISHEPLLYYPDALARVRVERVEVPAAELI